MGDHKGVAPLAPPRDADGPYHLNGMDSVVEMILRFRQEVLSCMDVGVITRDDQFAVFLQLADDLGEAVDELHSIGWPARRSDGKVVWESDGARPVATAEAAAYERAVRRAS